MIARAYELDEMTGIGVEFYEFRELGGSRRANQDDMKKIKEWFRKGMNIGASDEAVKGKSLKSIICTHAESSLAAIINEANVAFELNTGLFEVIETMAAEHTGLTPELESSEEEKIASEVPLESEGSLSEREYSVASVAAFIAAGTSLQV